MLHNLTSSGALDLMLETIEKNKIKHPGIVSIKKLNAYNLFEITILKNSETSSDKTCSIVMFKFNDENKIIQERFDDVPVDSLHSFISKYIKSSVIRYNVLGILYISSKAEANILHWSPNEFNST